jgi:hypothetical protein
MVTDTSVRSGKGHDRSNQFEGFFVLALGDLECSVRQTANPSKAGVQGQNTPYFPASRSCQEDLWIG